MTTTTENPITGNTAGSQRFAGATDTPWWKVRHSLAAGFVATIAAAGSLYYFAGIVPRGLSLNLRSLASVLALVSGTPILAAIGLTACMLMAFRTQRRPLKVLCGLLALASLAGAGLNVARQAYGHTAIEGLIERAVPAANARP